MAVHLANWQSRDVLFIGEDQEMLLNFDEKKTKKKTFCTKLLHFAAVKQSDTLILLIHHNKFMWYLLRC